MSGMHKPLPQIGARIIVNGWEDIIITVSDINYIPEEARHRINLDWGEFGSSYVYLQDEENIWRRFLDVN